MCGSISVQDILNHKWPVASFLLGRIARRERNRAVYTQRLAANHLAWPSRCVRPARTKPPCLETQYWRSACRRVASCVTNTRNASNWREYNTGAFFNLSPDCSSASRQFVFAAFTEEFISAPFTEPIFHFFIPALSDTRLSFPFEAFLSSLQATIRSSSVLHSQAPWVFYFVLSTGENRLGESRISVEFMPPRPCAHVTVSAVSAGSLSEEGLLLYLRGLQTLLPLLPVSEGSSRTEVSSDSEDDDNGTGIQSPPMQVRSSSDRSGVRITPNPNCIAILLIKNVSLSSRMTAESPCS